MKLERMALIAATAIAAASCAQWYRTGHWVAMAAFSLAVLAGLVALYPYPITSGPRPGGQRGDGRTTDGRSQGGDQ